ncbi:MAG: efflux RND transporter periplasmic adaptor subunit [Methylocella sp.]
MLVGHPEPRAFGAALKLSGTAEPNRAVKTPFASVITRRHADKGATIQSGLNETDAMPLFDLKDLRTIRLRVDVPENDATRIDQSAKAEILFPELPEARVEANISRLAYGLDPATRTMRVEIQTGRGEPVLAVPNEAIGNVKGRSFVFVVHGGTVKKVEVKTGLSDEHATEVLGSSIKASDRIVVRGKELVNDGAVVRV